MISIIKTKFMILYINTTDKISEIKLYDDKIEQIDALSFNGDFVLSEELTQKIDALIAASGFKKDLSLIVVNIGPGSYTGLRIGVTTANAIAFALDIPIVELSSEDDMKKIIRNAMFKKKFASPALPIYKNPPHITKKKVD